MQTPGRAPLALGSTPLECKDLVFGISQTLGIPDTVLARPSPLIYRLLCAELNGARRLCDQES